MKILCCAAVLLLGVPREDLLLADFEGKDYGAWKVSGNAFGPRPAQGTLPNQMPVSGFLGKGLVNTYFGGDPATGTLTSPAFTIERKHLSFLIGGGNHPDETCINLLVDGKVVRTATAADNEHLEWQGWDVEKLAGASAVIEIVDKHQGGWGHLNIDHIVQGDQTRQTGVLSRAIAVESRYLHLPVRTGAPKQRMKFLVGGELVREFEIELADREPSFWAFADVSAWKGKELTVISRGAAGALDGLTQGDEIKGSEPVYQEKQRPGFHFTSRRGWLNDPNGLVYSKGEYHLYYQHNPYGWGWGNMHWGHAVSKDLFHWEELPLAIYPARYGDWAFSGSAVVDPANSSGFKSGAEDVLVGAYTSTGRGECIVYSNDRGRTWKEYEGNPVVKHGGRDPKLVWHAPTKQWVMAVYDEKDKLRRIAFYTSPDLKTFTFQSLIDGFYECPDLFELPVDGDAAKSQWVLYAADAKYVIGSFDGKTFTPDGPKQTLWHGNFYAAQSYSDAPEGRRIQIGWANGVQFPGMPFNQQMAVPVELSLRSTDEGVRMFAWPVKEFDALRGATKSMKDLTVKAGENPLAGVEGELVDLRVEFKPGVAEQVVVSVRGVPVVYDVRKQELSCKGKTAALKPVGGAVRLRVLADRGSIEVFGNDGRAAFSVAAILPAGERSLSLSVKGGDVAVPSLDVSELTPAISRR